MRMWFSPQYFSIKDGKLHLMRMDGLINSKIRICTWGNIDLITKKIDMTLGVLGETIEHYLNIEAIPENFIIQIPIKGTIDNVKIDTKMATAKITALMASQANHKLGIFLGHLFSKMEGERPVPKPIGPFPWENDKNYKKKRKNIFGQDIFDLLK